MKSVYRSVIQDGNWWTPELDDYRLTVPSLVGSWDGSHFYAAPPAEPEERSQVFVISASEYGWQYTGKMI